MGAGAGRAEPNAHAHSDLTLGCEELTGYLNMEIVEGNTQGEKNLYLQHGFQSMAIYNQRARIKEV